MTVLLIFWLAFCLLEGTLSFPTGAPCSQKDTMTPDHKGGKTGKAPYRLQVSSACYQPGVSIKVTLIGKKTGETFKGFMVQARAINSEEIKRVGRFMEDGDREWQYPCAKYNDESLVTHTFNNNKTEISFYWSSYDDSVGPIRFIATVVQAYSTYWVQSVKSIKLKPCKEKTTTEPPKTQATTESLKPEKEPSEAFQKVNADRCNQAKGGTLYCPGSGGYVPRYYHSNGGCYHFWYGGCNGTANNFFTKKDCRDACIKKVEQEGPATDLCQLAPAQSGTWCKPPGGSWKWTFQNSACRRFFYLGCHGSRNRFETKTDCNIACLSPRNSCFRLADLSNYCESWTRADTHLCHKIGGSSAVRRLC